MKKHFSLGVAVFLTVLLFIQFFPVYQYGESGIEPQNKLDTEGPSKLMEALVYKNNENILDRKSELNVLEDYGSFALLEASSNTLEKFKEEGRLIRKLPVRDAHDSRIDDNRLGKRKYSQWKKEGRKPVDLYLLEFIGPIKEDWKKELQNKNIEIFETIEPFTHIVKMNHRLSDNIKNKEYVRTVKPYYPSLKIPSNNNKTKSEIQIYKVKVTKDVTPHEISETLSQLNGTLESFTSRELQYNYIIISLKNKKLKDFARENYVIRLTEQPKYKLLNDDSAWVIQSYDIGDHRESIWDKGIYGQNQIVGESDTGLDYDHAMFRDTPTSKGTPGSNHRKVVMYKSYADSKDTDSSGHGTHVAGSIAGDWGTYGEPDDNDGMAPAAKLAFYDIGGSGDSLKIPDDLTNMFQTQYDAGARVFSNSWGSSASYYTTDAEACDEFMWNHNDALILFAAGNSGPSNNTVGSPATAKNIVSVGNTINGESEDMAESSSNGPTDEGRLKPTVSAPGTNIISADSDGDLSTMNDGLISMTGTSMATPTTAGAAALVRQYYTDGWYPTGVKNSSNSITPSGALLKSTLVNSAWSMSGEYTDAPIPSMGQGWGKIKLDDALFFSGDSRSLNVLNDGNSGGMVSSGERHDYSVYAGDEQRLKVTLSWTDYPGSYLQNNLNLLVTAPDGTKYLGNVFKNGYSKTGGTADNNNVTEQVYIDLPQMQEGKYIISVIADTISHSPQKYALIATGQVDGSCGIVSFSHEKYNIPPVSNSAKIELKDTDLNSGPNIKETIEVTVKSDTETTGEQLLLTETGTDTSIFEGFISLNKASVSPDGILQVSDKDTITVEYTDGHPVGVRTDTAVIDSTPPILKNLDHPSVNEGTLISNAAQITWETDERSFTRIEYGESRSLGEVTNWNYLSYNHSIILENLKPNTTYYYKLISIDSAKESNTGIDDNEGALYTFKTPNWPETKGEGFSGYVYSVNGDTDSIFDRDIIYSGYYYAQSFFGPQEGPFYGGVVFDTSRYNKADLGSASVHLYPKEIHYPKNESKEWTFEILTDNSEGLFPDPTYNQLKSAETQFTITTKMTNELASPGGVDILDIPSEYLSTLKTNMNDGRVAVRIKGPKNVNYTDIDGWYSGHNIVNDEEIFKAPQLRINNVALDRPVIQFDRGRYTLEDYIHIRLRDIDKNNNYSEINEVVVNVSSNSDIEQVTLQESCKNTSIFKGKIRTSTDGEQTGILDVSNSDTIVIEYGENTIYKDTAIVENVPPEITSVSDNPKNDLTTVISWDTDEPSTSTVSYGTTDSLCGEKTDNTLKTHHEVKLTGLVRDVTYYYKISSMDSAGNKITDNNSGDLYSFKTPSSNIQPSIILIDDAGKTADYETSLQQSGYNYDKESISDTGVPTTDLNEYDITIWVTDGFTDLLTPSERELLEDFLNNGGHLFLNGEDIGYDIGDTDFYRDYLHSKYVNDYGGGSKIFGVSGDPISDGMYGMPLGGEYPSDIRPADTYAETVFTYDSGGNGGLKVDTGNYRVVYFAFEYYEGNDVQSNKTSLMSSIINWLDPSQLDDEGASVGNISCLSEEITWNESTTISGKANDLVAGGSNITDVEYFVDMVGQYGEGQKFEPKDGAFNTPVEDFNIQIDGTSLSEGTHTLYIHAKDSERNWGEIKKVCIEVQSSASVELMELPLSTNSASDNWQFISTTLIPEETDLESILEDSEYGISGFYEKVQYYDSSTQSWKSYNPNRASYFNDLNYWDNTMGLWIKMNADTTLTIQGTKPTQTTIKLNPGWNMVGYPSETSTNADQSLPDSISKVGIFDSSEKYNLRYVEDLSTLTLESGNGYWVYNDAEEIVYWNVEY